MQDPIKPKLGQRFVNERGEEVTFIGFGDREQEDWIYRDDNGGEGISVFVGRRRVLDKTVLTDDKELNEQFIDSLPFASLVKEMKKNT